MKNNISEHLIGVISDTHGMIKPSVLNMLQGVDLLLHAGDVGNATILELLERIAPVVAVQGNTDRGELADTLNQSEVVRIYDKQLYILHDIEDLDLEPRAAGFNAVISGHTHKASIRFSDNILFLNPGSATQNPFRPGTPSIALLKINKNRLEAEVILLT